MLQLANGCQCSNLTVHPKNWKQSSADTSLPWYIHYRFYDRTNNIIKPVIVKGMNHLTDLHQRRDATEALLNTELEMLKRRNYNPITGQFETGDNEPEYVIDPQMPFIAALRQAVKEMNASGDTKQDAKYVVNGIEAAAKQLRFDIKPVSEIHRRHLIAILKRCSKINKNWTANTFNSYRANLLMLYKVLIEMETVDFNPVRDIGKQTTVKKIRERLTPDQRRIVNNHLHANHYRFWLYTQIFFHSGSRTAELFRLQGKDIDLAGQRFKCIIMKRKQPVEIWKPIKDIAVGFWQEAVEGCGGNDFVFSKGLQPGPDKILAEQITKRWRKHVKKELGITADFYPLKHLNLDETAEALSIEDAAKMAAHTTPVITMEVYAIGEKERQDQRLKKVRNPFSS
jgi:integrase